MRPLDVLAERLGVEPRFRDASGVVRRPPAAVKRRLLAAMGVEVARSADVEFALAELERRRWSEPLHAAVILESSRPAAAALTLQSGTGEVRWSAAEEHGGEHTGAVRFAALELVERHGEAERRNLRIDAPLPCGYHRLTIETDDARASAALIVVPERCHLPEPMLRGERLWGLTVQLYGVRSERNWGIGDFTDLAALARAAGRLGADVIGLNPLHAAFPGAPSPYSPASRLFLNALYIDVTAVPELASSTAAQRDLASPELRSAIEACRDSELVDYAAVERLKMPLLETLFETFEQEAAPERREAFDAFRAERGHELERFSIWQALYERFVARNEALRDWRRWPREYRDARSAAVARFAQRKRRRVRFLEWLQWIADEQLAAAAAAARDAGLSIGLQRDLAVGADGAGAEAWSDAPLFASRASIGAPADLFNPSGQDWGLPPFDPHALRRNGYSAFVELVRSNMRHAGALRIDHAMGLEHLYWVARGRPPAEGAYVTYPFDALGGIIALESARNRCLVVGEDLGTVPEGFRARMRERGVLSYRIVFFEQDEDGRLTEPESYPSLALAALGSHDLAPLKGWWQGRDLVLKRENGLYPIDDAYREQLARRAVDRARLVESLERCGIPLPKGFGAHSAYEASLSVAAHAFLARTSAQLAAIQLEDIAEESELVNLPGCAEGYPSWRRKLSVPIERIESLPLVTALAALFRASRSAAAS